MKDIFKRIASLVVETEGSPSASQASASPTRKTIADLVRDAPGPNLDEVHVPVSKPVPEASPPPAASGDAPPPATSATGPIFGADGQVDIQAIYQKANLPQTPFSAEQAYEMIQGLPAELPLATKRQTVKITLSAMGKTLGVTPETVVTDAGRKAAALHSFVEGMAKQSEVLANKIEGEIRSLEERISEGRRNIQAARERVAGLESFCEAEALKLQETAEFFSTGP